MAANNCEITAQAIALVAATAKTVIQITAPTNQALKVKGFRVSFDGANSAAAPVTAEYGRPSSAGTFTAQTPVKKDSGRGETVQTTGGVNASAEPTWTSVGVGAFYLGAFNGLLREYFPFDNPIIVPGGTRFALRLTAAAAVNACVTLEFEE